MHITVRIPTPLLAFSLVCCATCIFLISSSRGGLFQWTLSSALTHLRPVFQQSCRLTFQPLLGRMEVHRFPLPSQDAPRSRNRQQGQKLSRGKNRYIELPINSSMYLGPNLWYQSQPLIGPNLQETSKKSSAPQVLCSWQMPVGAERHRVHNYQPAFLFDLQAIPITHRAFLSLSSNQ